MFLYTVKKVSNSHVRFFDIRLVPGFVIVAAVIFIFTCRMKSKAKTKALASGKYVPFSCYKHVNIATIKQK